MSILALAPFLLDAPWLSVALGFGFGFVLESSGFGDSRRLAAQFYLTEMRVLQVMFTAIVTCLLLLTVASSAGWLDFGALRLNPTWLGSALVGGLLLGVGFVVGGYCPGTSIVSAATGKVDGMFFLGGVGVGVFAFGEAGDRWRDFYDHAGYLGEVTLPDVLGLPFGATVALVVTMAVGMFAAATALERRAGAGRPDAGPGPATWGIPVRALSAAALGALLVALVAFARPASGEGSVERREELLRPSQDARLAARAVHVDPLELLGLLHREIAGAPARFGLELIDVRPEADFHRFHLEDARRWTPQDLRGPRGRDLTRPAHATSIQVVLANDEAAAEQAWRTLDALGVRHVYVLEGGVNLWLDVFREGRVGARAAVGAAADGTLRHAFASSLGARHPFARPSASVYRDLLRSGARPFTPRVRPVAKPPRSAGGCG